MKRLIVILTSLMIFQVADIAAQESQDPPLYKIDKLEFNTGPFSEISPVIIRDGIMFCSDKRFSAIRDRTGFDGRRLYNIYVAQKKDSSRWTTPKMLQSERSMLFNSGPLSVASDGKTVYFTSEVVTGEEAKKKNFRNHNGIFIGELSGNELVSIRPFQYNSTQYETGHPSISQDGRYLYFSSNMPGGMGKSDLYYSELVNGQWGQPVNLGPEINSPGSESYPYMHPSGRLYFTSDKPGGFGKLDVYATSFYNGKWEKPELLPEPVNSGSDDFSFMASEDMQTGYFSSDRNFSDDIFRFSSTIIRKLSCREMEENSFCYRFVEENAIKYDTLPFRYEWSFGDGSKAEGPVVEHCFAGPGKYIVKLDVTNLITKEVMRDQKADTLFLEKIEQPYITMPEEIHAGQPVQLDASQTWLPGWEIARYYWNFGDETIATGERVNKTFARPGNYNIQLIVTSKPGDGGVAEETCVSKNINVLPKR